MRLIAWVAAACLPCHGVRGGEFIDLSASAETDSGANAINNSGVIVGYTETERIGSDGFPIYDAFICKGAIPYPLQLDLPDLVSSFALDVNNSGQIVGYYTKTDKSESCFFYENGAGTEIREPGSTACYVNGLNDSGQMIGFSSLPDGSKRGFLYFQGSFTPLTLPDASLTPQKINNMGEVVGNAFGNSKLYLFSYLNGTVTPIHPENDTVSYGILGLNNAGQILVSRYSEADGSQYGFYRSETYMPVPEGGSLTALNDQGDLGGREKLPSGPGVPQDAVQLILIKGGQTQRLGSLGGAKVAVSDLNESDQMVGYAETPDKKYHTFLYSPTPVISPGDVDNDRKVDVADVVRTLQSVVGLATLTPDETRSADVVSDGIVDVSDAVRMLRVVVGLDPEF